MLDQAWDSARRAFKASPGSSIHSICGQSIELVLKASVASRTLDNITGVLIAFKNFRKTLKAEVGGGIRLRPPGAEAFRAHHLAGLFSLPNGDLNLEDVERPENMSRSEVSLDM